MSVSAEENHAVPSGFLSCVVNAGVRADRPDFALVYSPNPCNAAACFTKSTFAGPPVLIGRKHIETGELQALFVISGNANVATGPEGYANQMRLVEAVADNLGIAKNLVFPSATGVIGRQFPMDRILPVIGTLRNQLGPADFSSVARTIMTTDTHPKIHSCRIGRASLLGIAKGSGMIQPDMATMLSYIFTDADIPSGDLKRMLARVVDNSFNMVSVDSDTSTSDTVAIFASRIAGEVDSGEFELALSQICTNLAKDIARDGEGATKLIEVTVSEAATRGDARTVAKSIVNSPLVKTAVYGRDPNWGRVAMAIGKVNDLRVDPSRVKIAFGPHVVYNGAAAGERILSAVRTYLEGNEIAINVALGSGRESATAWGCDLTEGYVKINADYTT